MKLPMHSLNKQLHRRDSATVIMKKIVLKVAISKQIENDIGG